MIRRLSASWDAGRADRGDPASRGTQPMVEAHGLVKRYRTGSGDGFTAVDGIDFSLNRGECFGLLGPHGAGKSSTMR